MATNKNPIFPDDPKPSGVNIAAADVPVTKTVFLAGTDGALVDVISAVTDDPVAVVVGVIFFDGTTEFPMGEVTVPASAGTDGGTTPAFNILNPDFLILQAGGAMPLQAGDEIRVSVQTAMTGGDVIDFVASAGDY